MFKLNLVHVPAARAPRALLRRLGAGARRVQAGQAAKGQDGWVVDALLQLAAGRRALHGILRAFPFFKQACLHPLLLLLHHVLVCGRESRRLQWLISAKIPQR